MPAPVYSALLVWQLCAGHAVEVPLSSLLLPGKVVAKRLHPFLRSLTLAASHTIYQFKVCRYTSSQSRGPQQTHAYTRKLSLKPVMHALSGSCVQMPGFLAALNSLVGA